MVSVPPGSETVPALFSVLRVWSKSPASSAPEAPTVCAEAALKALATPARSVPPVMWVAPL